MKNKFIVTKIRNQESYKIYEDNAERSYVGMINASEFSVLDLDNNKTTVKKRGLFNNIEGRNFSAQILEMYDKNEVIRVVKEYVSAVKEIKNSNEN